MGWTETSAMHRKANGQADVKAELDAHYTWCDNIHKSKILKSQIVRGELHKSVYYAAVERKEQREAERAKSNELQSAKLAEALNNRGSYHERLIKILTEGAGHVGIVSKYAFSNIGETFPESEEGAKALKWWTDREVSYTFTASGLVLYIGSYHSNWHDLKYIDYQAWDND